MATSCLGMWATPSARFPTPRVVRFATVKSSRGARRRRDRQRAARCRLASHTAQETAFPRSSFLVSPMHNSIRLVDPLFSPFVDRLSRVGRSRYRIVFRSTRRRPCQKASSHLRFRLASVSLRDNSGRGRGEMGTRALAFSNPFFPLPLCFNQFVVLANDSPSRGPLA